MEFVRGMIVRATAGRDQGGFFTVLSVEGDYAMICNGKRRPLEQPKKKKLKHLAPTHTVLSEQSMETNRESRRARAAFQK